MSFSVQLVAQYRVIEADTFAAGGRLAAMHIATAQITGASAREAKLGTISAGVVDLALTLDPVAAS
jgi:hypothetical protein